MKTVRKLEKKTTITLVVVGAVVAATAVACGHHARHPSPKIMQRLVLGHVDDMMDEVDASDDQRATFESAAQTILTDALAMHEAHKADKAEMLKVLSAPTVDRDAVKSHIEAKLDTVEAFALRSVDTLIDAFETLDDPQKQILLEKLATHFENN